VKLALLACTFAVVIAVPATAAQVEGPAPDREITVIRDGLYRVRDGTRHTVFLVTPDGIILADPLSRDTSRWLPQEFATRFPGRTVRYVLHTHHHADRAEGAALFNNTAELSGTGSSTDSSSALSRESRTYTGLSGPSRRRTHGACLWAAALSRWYRLAISIRPT